MPSLSMTYSIQHEIDTLYSFGPTDFFVLTSFLTVLVTVSSLDFSSFFSFLLIRSLIDFVNNERWITGVASQHSLIIHL